MSADPSSSSSCKSLVSLGLRSQPSSQSSISDADKGAGLQHNYMAIIISWFEDLYRHAYTQPRTCIIKLMIVGFGE